MNSWHVAAGCSPGFVQFGALRDGFERDVDGYWHKSMDALDLMPAGSCQSFEVSGGVWIPVQELARRGQ